MSRARLRELVVLFAIGSALTLAVLSLRSGCCRLRRLLRFRSRDFLDFSDFTSSGTAAWAANRSLNFLFTVRSGTTRERHRTMAEFASARSGIHANPHAQATGPSHQSWRAKKWRASGTSPPRGFPFFIRAASIPPEIPKPVRA